MIRSFKKSLGLAVSMMLGLSLQGCKKKDVSETKEFDYLEPEATPSPTPKPTPTPDAPVNAADLKKAIYDFVDGKLAAVTAAGTPIDAKSYLCFDHAFLLYSQDFVDFAKTRGINIKKIHVMGFYTKKQNQTMTVAALRSGGGTSDPAATFRYFTRTDYVYNSFSKAYDPVSIPMVTIERPEPTSLYHAAVTLQTGDYKWWYSDQNGRKPWGRFEEGPESYDAWISSSQHVKDVEAIIESTLHLFAKKVLKPFVTPLSVSELNGKVLPYTPPPPPTPMPKYSPATGSSGSPYNPLPYFPFKL